MNHMLRSFWSKSEQHVWSDSYFRTSNDIYLYHPRIAEGFRIIMSEEHLNYIILIHTIIPIKFGYGLSNIVTIVNLRWDQITRSSSLKNSITKSNKPYENIKKERNIKILFKKIYWKIHSQERSLSRAYYINIRRTYTQTHIFRTHRRKRLEDIYSTMHAHTIDLKNVK